MNHDSWGHLFFFGLFNIVNNSGKGIQHFFNGFIEVMIAHDNGDGMFFSCS